MAIHVELSVSTVTFLFLTCTDGAVHNCRPTKVRLRRRRMHCVLCLSTGFSNEYVQQLIAAQSQGPVSIVYAQSAYYVVIYCTWNQGDLLCHNAM